jgi:hypothetical protein
VKTQIIQLNTGDDYISVRDKLDWSQSRQILLVWPAHVRWSQGKLELKLIRQHAISMGLQLAVVTKDRQVKFLARQVNLPVFKSILQAQNSEWEPNKLKEIPLQEKSQSTKLLELRQKLAPGAPSWWEHPAARVFSLSISVLAFLSLAVLILPGATITIVPKVESQTMIFDILTDPSTTIINYSSGSIPTYQVETVVQGEETIHVSGSAAYPDQPAVGQLSFKNTSSETITIPVGTIVTTQETLPIRFITTSPKEITVKPEQTVQLEAQAMIPGESGNLAKNQLVVIEGSVTPSLTVTNLIPTTGGTQKNIPAPSLQDQASLRKQLITKLERAALDKMQIQLAEGDWIISPTLSLVETSSETYFPALGEPGNTLKLAMEAQFQAQVVSDDTLRRLVEPIMDAYTPSGYLGVPNSLAYTQTSLPIQVNDGKTQIKIKATRSVLAQIPQKLVAQSILGRTTSQAEENLLASIPVADQAQINLFPGWWPRMPWLGMRVKVIQTDNYENLSR